MDSPEQSPKLILTDYDASVYELIIEAMHGLAQRSSDLLAGIQFRKTEFIPSEVPSDGTARGGFIHTESVESTLSFPCDAFLNTDIETWVAALFNASEELRGKIESPIVGTLREMAMRQMDSAGTRGLPLTVDRLLDMLENLDFEVGEDGQPKNLQFFGSSDAVDQLRSLPPMTREQEARYRAIIADKKRKHDAKKRIRKLD